MLRANIWRLGEQLIRRGAWYFAPFSWVYACAVFVRNQLYNQRLLPIVKVRATVVSVGNIVAGGTGKTPFVLWLAKQFAHRRVAILSRGYGEMPDEAMLLARRLPHAAVYVGKDRVSLAQKAEADLLILDDGFQYRKLHRDFDIVLVREKKEHYLPWGFLRDSPRRLTGAEVIGEADLPLKVKRILDLQGREIPSIKGWKVGIFCGIANPDRFKQTVRDLGAEIGSATILADHEAANLNKLPKGSPLICTEKDAVKLPPTDLPIYFLEMELEPAGLEKLIERIDQTIDNHKGYD